MQIATGARYAPLDPATPGALDVHGNPNVVTRDQGTSKLAQATSAMSCLVEVEKYAETAPEVSTVLLPKIETA